MVKAHDLQPGNLTFIPRTATDSSPLSEMPFQSCKCRNKSGKKKSDDEKKGGVMLI